MKRYIFIFSILLVTTLWLPFSLQAQFGGRLNMDSLAIRSLTISSALDLNGSLNADTVYINGGATIIDTLYLERDMYFKCISPPPAPTVVVNSTAGNLNGNYYYKIVYVTADGETEPGITSDIVAPANQRVDITVPVGPTGVISRKIYRTVAGGLEYFMKLVTTISGNTNTVYTDNIADGSLGVSTPVRNSTGGNIYISGMNVFEASRNVTRVGYNCLPANKGYFNTAFGAWAMGNGQITGYCNTAIGEGALEELTSGDYNTAVGVRALCKTTTGGYNVAVGKSALWNNISGSNNVALGIRALQSTQTTSNNVAIGSDAMYSATTGDQNFALGTETLTNLTTGDRNVAIGHQAMYNGVTSSSNVAIGRHALFGAGSFHNNIGIGGITGFNLAAGSNENILIGVGAGYSLTTSDGSIIIGHDNEAPSATTSYQLDIGDLIYGSMANPKWIGFDGATQLKNLTADPSTGEGLYIRAKDSADADTLIFRYSNGALKRWVSQ